MNKCIFPGSFDPFHEGHKYVIESALKDYDFVYVIISWNNSKIRKHSYNEIKNIIEKEFENKNIKVIINENKLVPNIANELNVFNIVRGFRNFKDRLYEHKLKKSYLNLNANLSFKYYKSPKHLSSISSSSINKK